MRKEDRALAYAIATLVALLVLHLLGLGPVGRMAAGLVLMALAVLGLLWRLWKHAEDEGHVSAGKLADLRKDFER